MQNINNIFNNFPANSEEYFDNKPIGLTNQQWLFDRTNPYYFCFWVSAFIYFIHNLSILRIFTFATLESLAEMFGKSSRTLRDVLKPLVAIGVLEVRIIKKNKQYKVNWELLRSREASVVNNRNQTATSGITSAIFDENIPESPFDLIDYEDEISATIRDSNNSNRSLSHENDDFSISDPSILESKSDKKKDQPQPPSDLIELDPLEIEIKQEFEKITGNTLNLKKNRKPLAELKELAKQAKDIVKLAFRNIANHIAETGTKVYNLGYVLTTVKNLMKPKASPTTMPRNYAPASEQDKAYASIGGNSLSSSTQEPTTAQQTQEIEEARNLRQVCEQRPTLGAELYNNLDEAEKKQLIKEEINYLKTQPIWQKLHPNFPALDMGFAIHYAIEKIKNFLLLEYLDYQQDLASQSSG